MGLFLFVFLTI